MLLRPLHHIRRNVVAYLALVLAAGAGGGYALAAGNARTIHACVVTRTGELLIRGRCGRGERRIVWNQTGPRGPQGLQGIPGSPTQETMAAFGEVGGNGLGGSAPGLNIQQTSTGTYAVTVTASQCASAIFVEPVVSPFGGPAASGPEAGQPVAWVDPGTTGSNTSFVVRAGNLVNGAYQASNQGFNIMVACGR